jgi:hypothetical protein
MAATPMFTGYGRSSSNHVANSAAFQYWQGFGLLLKLDETAKACEYQALRVAVL